MDPLVTNSAIEPVVSGGPRTSSGKVVKTNERGPLVDGVGGGGGGGVGIVTQIPNIIGKDRNRFSILTPDRKIFNVASLDNGRRTGDIAKISFTP